MQHGGRGELSIGSTKTGKGRRVVLPAFLADELAAHLSTTYTKVTKPTDPLFAGEFKADTYHRHNNFYLRHFKPAVKAALPPEKHALRFHDLRHTAASLALSVPAPTFTWSRRCWATQASR